MSKEVQDTLRGVGAGITPQPELQPLEEILKAQLKAPDQPAEHAKLLKAEEIDPATLPDLSWTLTCQSWSAIWLNLYAKEAQDSGDTPKQG